MHYSSEQKRYIAVFMQHIRLGLSQGNQKNSWISSVLGTASQGVGYTSTSMQIVQTLSTAVGIAGIVAAPATLGISIGAAGTIISVAQGGYQFYQVAQKALGKEETAFISDEVLRKSATLAFEILFEEVATSLAMQYRFFIDTKATNAGIDSLAIFAVKEVMQQWLVLTEKKQPISIETLIAPLYKSRHTAESLISVNAEEKILGVATERYYATGLYPLAAVAYLDTRTTPAVWMGYQRSKTKIEYGYRTSLTVPAKHHLYSSSPDWSAISPHLSAEFLINASTISVVKDYLIVKRRDPSTGSLNDYLSNLYGVHLIAACHDTSLQQISDLSEGDFSYVNFRRADLRGCILANTRWDDAYLTHAIFGNPKDPISLILPTLLQLHGAQFNGAHLEASFWENTDFSGALFLSAHMRGATLIYCQLGTLQHAGCEWDLAQWQDMQVPDTTFFEQLEAEQMARSKLEKDIRELSGTIEETRAFVAAIQMLIHSVQSTLTNHEEKIGQLESQVHAMQALDWPTSTNVPSYIPRPLHALYSAYLNAFENTRLQNTLEFYIEPNALAFKGAENLHPLSQDLIRFAEGSNSVLLVNGEVGAGKSSIARLYQKKLWSEWQDESSPAPLLLELKQVSPNTRKFLKAHLNSDYGYTDEQIAILQERYRFVFIFDGLDECPSVKTRHIVEDCELPRWDAKALLTTRTEWMTAIGDYRAVVSSNKTVPFLEAYVAPFLPMQIDAYLEKKFAGSTRDWTEYRNFINQSKALAQMAVSPVMLRILCDVLPNLINKAEQGQSTDYTRFGLYDEFLKSWFECEIAKEYDKTRLQEQSDEEFMAEFLYYTQALAFTMLCESTLFVQQRYQVFKPAKTLGYASMIVKKDPWADFFDNSNNLRGQRSCPLSVDRFDKEGQRYHRYQFIHKSFMEHAAATWLWDRLDTPDFDMAIFVEVWNQRFITEERGILAFLAERLRHSSNQGQLESRLLEMVLASRNNPVIEKAASSAISLLNAVDFEFYKRVPNQDLSHICISNADLSGARLMSVDCSYINATGVDFHDAVLVGAKLCHAILINVRFLAGESFVLSENEVNAMVLYQDVLGLRFMVMEMTLLLCDWLMGLLRSD